MLNEYTLTQLRALRLDGMVAALTDAATQIAASELPFEQRLALLVQPLPPCARTFSVTVAPSVCACRAAARTPPTAFWTTATTWPTASAPRPPGYWVCRMAWPCCMAKHEEAVWFLMRQIW